MLRCGGSGRIELFHEQKSALVSRPIGNILPDEIFQHFGFSGAGGTAEVEMG
jgi:hypothetical protein